MQMQTDHAISRQTARLGFLDVDVLTLPEAVQRIAELALAGHGGTVFTPNIDHVVRAESDAEFRAAYRQASLSIVDGMPLVWASRLIGPRLRQRAAGSDWLEPLLSVCAREGHSVYFIGGREGAGDRAKLRLQSTFPTLRVVGIGPRTRAIEADPSLLALVTQDLLRLRPTFAVVALGSPLQEKWSTEVCRSVAPTVLLNLGSALDLAAGLVQRSPRWMSAAGLEWLFRLSREPGRLWKRYVFGGLKFSWIVWRQIWNQRR